MLFRTIYYSFKSVFWLLLLLLPVSLGGQGSNFAFTNLNKTDGLASNWCHVAFQDSRGYMWFGTQDGLSKYDGEKFTTYRHVVGDEASLPGNIVKDIQEDWQGRLWMASNGGGLSCFDPVTEQFQQFRRKSVDFNSPFCESMVSLFLDQEKVLWVGNYDCGFHAFDIEKGSFKSFALTEKFNTREEAFKYNSVIDIVPDVSDSDVLWLAGNDGLYKFNKKTEHLTRFTSNFPGAKDVGIFSILMDRPNEIWMGTYGAGVARLDLKTGQWQHFFPSPAEWNRRNEKANLVYSIKRKSQHELWICSQSEGFAVFNIRTSSFSFQHPMPEDPYSFGSSEAYSVSEGKDGLLWVTTRRRGVFQLDPNYKFIKSRILCRDDCEAQAMPQDVTDFAWDEKLKKLYVVAKGTRDIFIFNQQIQFEKRVKTGIPTGPAGGNYAVLVDSRNTVWVGGRSTDGQNPLFRYFPGEDRVEVFQYKINGQLYSHQLEILDLLEDSRKNIWAAASYGGLFKIISTKNKTLELKAATDKNTGPLPTNKINQLSEDRSGKLWLSTSDMGVYRFDPAGRIFTNYSKSFDDTPGLTENMTNSVLEDNHGNIWVGTNANGINMLNFSSSSAPAYSFLQMKDGLPDDHILKMVKDQRGDIWVYTISGLGFYDQDKEQFIVYDEKQGLKGGHSWEMGLFAADGKIFVGRNNGFYYFDVDSLQQEIIPPPVVLTSFKVFETELFFGKNLNYLDKIVLNHDQNFFSVSFAALNFSNPEKNQYAYKLEGFNQDWVYPSDNRNVAGFTNVPAGTYTFHVIASNDRGVWNRDGVRVPIVIRSPWYLTWWACLIYGVSILGLGYFAYRYQKSRWELQTSLLLEQKEAGQLRELHQMRSRLYTNITHEFRTPLTVILGLAAEIKDQEKYTELIIRNGRRLLNLINQLLDISKAGHGSLQLHLKKGDVVFYIKYVIESMQSLANVKSIELGYSSDLPAFTMDFDPERLRQVLYNLISNAIKFTPDQGQVNISLNFETQASPPILHIKVSDTGIGMEEKYLAHIFDSFYQIENPDPRILPGTGIGLALTAELVKMMEGKVEVNSKPGKGSVFTVTLPAHDREGVAAVIFPAASELIMAESGLDISDAAKGDRRQIAVPDRNTRPVVLIVEDNPDVVVYLTSVLSEDYLLEITHNGLEGVEKAIEIVPDIVISDVMMPGMDGLALCNQLKNDERTSHVPIILLTARATIADRIAGLERGADAYIAKPFHKKELRVEIKKLLLLRQQLQIRYSSLAAEPVQAQGLEMEDAFVRKAVEAVNNHLSDEHFGPEELGKLLFISRSQLHRKLSALTGKSASHFIRHVRMEQAYEFLKNGSNVSQTAREVGFSELSYFSKVFKDFYGFSPREVGKH